MKAVSWFDAGITPNNDTRCQSVGVLGTNQRKMRERRGKCNNGNNIIQRRAQRSAAGEVGTRMY